ncbi:hypothetical protein DPU24_16350 [Salmonella enterica subsp. enterica serovar Oranienburg]|nr:hypothetical protein [Salmonella enterica subsp. enterica serovar Oranienburg]
MDVKQWLNFDKTITPAIIKYIYWILLFFTIASSLLGMMLSPILIPINLIVLIVSIIFLRISCEMVILMFNIYQQVKKIADNIPDKSSENIGIHN